VQGRAVTVARDADARPSHVGAGAVAGVKAREINDEEEGIGEKIKKMGITIILYLLSTRTCRFAKWVKKKKQLQLYRESRSWS
jgi:hypothetical protein